MSAHIDMEAPEIKLKPRAIAHLKEIIENENIPEIYGLRIMAEEAQGQIHYHLGFDKTNSEKDFEYNFEGIKVLVDLSLIHI